MMRCLSMVWSGLDTRCRALDHLIRCLTKTALATGVVGEGAVQLRRIKARPEAGREKAFGVGGLPEQAGGQSHLAAGADQQVRIARMGQRGGFTQTGFGDVTTLSRQPARRLRNVPASAIVETDVEHHALVVGGGVLSPLQTLNQPGRKPAAITRKI